MGGFGTASPTQPKSPAHSQSTQSAKEILPGEVERVKPLLMSEQRSSSAVWKPAEVVEPTLKVESTRRGILLQAIYGDVGVGDSGNA